MKFQTPVVLQFKVPAALQGRLPQQMPVGIYNPLTSQYESTGFTAVLSADGGTLTASVTHFTVFVVLQPFTPFASLILPPGASVRPLGLVSLFLPLPPPPTISLFNPTSGPVGTSVVITGTDFTGATAVKFGAGTATSFTVDSPTQITATVPAAATTGPISVTTLSGTAASATDFTVILIPDLTISKTDSSDPVITEAGLTYTVIVQNAGNGAASGVTVTDPLPVLITATPSCSTTVGTCLVSAGPPFTVTASIGTLAAGASATVSIVTIAPTVTGTTVITDTASVADSGAETNTSNNQVMETTTVINPATTAPSITSFTPTSGPVGTSVTITGINFTPDATVQFRFSGSTADFVNASAVNVVSNTTLSAIVPTGATTGPIRVVTPGGTAETGGSFIVTDTIAPLFSTFTGALLPGAGLTLFNPFPVATGVPGEGALLPGAGLTLFNPFLSISSFTPTSGTQGTTVTIFGTGFQSGAGVIFGTTPASSPTVVSETLITVVVPGGATTGPITVTNPDLTSANSGDTVFFVVTSPTISGFSPGSGAIGSTVTINGTGFATGVTVTFNGALASITPDSVTPSTKMTAVVPADATTGPIVVTNPDGGTATSTSDFTVTTASGISVNATTCTIIGSVCKGRLLPGAGLTLFNPFPTATGSVGALLPGAALTLFNPFPTATGVSGAGTLLPGAGLTLFNPFPTATGSVGVGALLPGAGLTLFNPFPTAIGSVGVGRLLPGAGLTLFNPFPTATGSVGVGALLPGAALTLFNPITMSLVSGNNQTGAAGSRLANPLVVLVKDTLGRPVAGVAATFTVTAGGGTVSVTGTGGSAVTTAATNLQGFASVTWTLGSTPGSNTVTATSVGVLGSPVTFNATGN